MLQQTFIALTQKYTADLLLSETLWKEIEKKYSERRRHYHTLSHLDNLFNQLTEVKTQIDDWDTILFSLFYHDAIYNAARNDNEEKSAALAGEKLKLLGYPEIQTELCIAQILATKGHSVSINNDTNLFTDADLSILGMDWNTYSDYFKQVRKEYSIYPDFMYKPGRKKVLQHFLSMEKIFKTKSFFDKFENSARENLQKELDQL